MPFVILKRVELYISKPADMWKLYDRLNMWVLRGVFEQTGILRAE
jgi:hypothetical protein